MHDASAIPPEPTARAVTHVLHRLVQGDNVAADLSAMLYQDLRRLAEGLMRRERTGHTLQATALVHEAWLRLVDATAFHGDHVAAARSRFLGIAVQAMRRILVEHARGRLRDKRGGQRERVDLSVAEPVVSEDAGELLDLDAALEWLAQRRPRAAQIAELRIYGGLTVAEAGDVVSVALATAKADWNLAQALLTQRVRAG